MMLSSLLSSCLLVHVAVAQSSSSSNCPHLRTDLERWHDSSTWPSNSVPIGGNVQLPSSTSVLFNNNLPGTLETLTIPSSSELIADNIIGDELRLAVQALHVDGTITFGSATCPYRSNFTLIVDGTTVTPDPVGRSSCPHFDPELKIWTDRSIWPNEIVPIDGDVTLPPNTKVLFTNPLPNRLGIITIPEGSELVIDDTGGDAITLAATDLIGKFTVGSSTCPYYSNFTLALSGGSFTFSPTQAPVLASSSSSSLSFMATNHDPSSTSYEFCSPILPDTCPTSTSPNCVPYRSPEIGCPPDESFTGYIKERTTQIRTNTEGTVSDGQWFHLLEDKIAGWYFTESMIATGYAPTVYCCISSAFNLADCNPTLPTSPSGYVIKATDKHSNVGIYVLPSGYGGPELLSGSSSMSFLHILSELESLRASKIIIEEYVEGPTPNSLPTEFKFHIFPNGVIGAVDIVAHRGDADGCACYAVMDGTLTERIDQHGCFEHATPTTTAVVRHRRYLRLEQTTRLLQQDPSSTTTCAPTADYVAGARRTGYVKRDLPICGNLPTLPPACIVQDMHQLAMRASQALGVYMRVDMFVSGTNDKVYIQEYSPNHMNGLRHCAAPTDTSETDGCTDSCYLGRLWKESSSSGSLLYGSSNTTVPAAPSLFDTWALTDASTQCTAATSTTPDETPEPFTSHCPP